MAFELSFAGEPFALETEEALDLIEKRISFRELREIMGLNPWPGKNLAGLAIPHWPASPSIRLGQFFYPTGASRWAEFHGLATTAQKDRMLAAAVPSFSSQPSSATFVCKADASAGDSKSVGGISTSMYLLPPRPLAVYSTSLDGLWLITLVDERYYWQFKNAGSLVIVDGTTTWSDLIDSIAAGLGITLQSYTVDSVYGKPAADSPLWSNSENAAVLLDAAAWNIGRIFVRKEDSGTKYSLVKPLAANATDVPANRAQDGRMAGGEMWDMNEAIDETGVSTIFTTSAVVNAVIPQEVKVTFPKYTADSKYLDTRDSRAFNRVSYGAVYSKTVSLSDAGFLFAGFAGTLVIRDTARYINGATDGAVPISTSTNNSQVGFAAAHGYTTGDLVQVSATGGGLTAGTDYYVRTQGNFDISFHVTAADATANTGKVSLTGDITAFVGSEGAVGNRNIDLLAVQLAKDYYNHQLGNIDDVYPGIRAWTPDAINDLIFVFRRDACYTRVMRKPWNFMIVDMQHGGTDFGLCGGDQAVIAQVNNATPDANGLLDATIQTYNPKTQSWGNVENIWIRDANANLSGTVGISATAILANRSFTVVNGRITAINTGQDLDFSTDANWTPT